MLLRLPGKWNGDGCRSLVLTCLLVFWVPFGTIFDIAIDIWHVLLKWNQYVGEYEMTSLKNVSTQNKTPFAESAPQGTKGGNVQQSCTTESLPSSKVLGEDAFLGCLLRLAMQMYWDAQVLVCVYCCSRAAQQAGRSSKH